MRNGRPARTRREAEAKPRPTAAPRTVELFAGIGGFRVAADACGLTTVWANDAAPRACAVYREQFGPIVEGDLRTRLDDVPEHDLLTAGFPCQPFSSAGKKHGVRDPRGTLFKTIVDLLARRRPTAFVLENVKRLLSMERGEHFATVLDALAGLDYRVEWRLVNVRHLGLPQNRERVVLVGARRVSDDPRLASPSELAIDVPARRRWPAIREHRERFPPWGVAQAGRWFGAAPCTFADAVPCGSLRELLEPAVDADYDFTASTAQRLGASRAVNRFVQGVEILSNQAGGSRMGYTVFGVEGVAPTLTATTSRHYERYRIGDRYRRLTPTEYARLQGFPDDHCAAVSRYDQYALYGNAVPPPLAEWALRRTLTI